MNAYFVQNILQVMFHEEFNLVSCVTYSIAQMNRITPHFLTVNKLDEALFHCVSENEVIWNFNGRQLPHTAQVIPNKKHGSFDLRIFPTFIENRGSYWCLGEIPGELYGFYDVAYLRIKFD